MKTDLKKVKNFSDHSPEKQDIKYEKNRSIYMDAKERCFEIQYRGQEGGTEEMGERADF